VDFGEALWTGFAPPLTPARAFWHEVSEYLMSVQFKDDHTLIVITDDPKDELSWEKKKK